MGSLPCLLRVDGRMLSRALVASFTLIQAGARAGVVDWSEQAYPTPEYGRDLAENYPRFYDNILEAEAVAQETPDDIEDQIRVLESAHKKISRHADIDERKRPFLERKFGFDGIEAGADYSNNDEPAESPEVGESKTTDEALDDEEGEEEPYETEDEKESPKIVDEKESSNKSDNGESSKILDDDGSSKILVDEESSKALDENKSSQTLDAEEFDDEEFSKILDGEESSKTSDDEESINDDEGNSKTTLALKSDKAEEVSNSAAEVDESFNKEESVLKAKETGTDYHDETSDSDSVGGKTEGEITTVEPNSVEILTEISEPSKKRG